MATIILTALFHNLAPVAAMDRLGEDKVQKIYVGDDPEAPTKQLLVLLDFDFSQTAESPESNRLATAISAVARLGPQAIIIDQQITRFVPEKAAGLFISAEQNQKRSLFSRSFSALTELLTGSPVGKTSGPGYGTRYRSAGADTLSLHWLPVIAVDGALFQVGAPDLTLVWTGGKPPFTVSLETESGRALGAFDTDMRVLQLHDFVMPSEPVLVQVGDEQGQPITATLRPADPEPRSVEGPMTGSAAIDRLTSVAPNRRLDALGRLSRLAGADPQAAEAIGLVRQTADAPP